MKPSRLVTSAILGILAGAACGGAQHPPVAPQASVDPKSAKDTCGNHPPGACGAVEGAKASAPTGDAGAPTKPAP